MKISFGHWIVLIMSLLICTTPVHAHETSDTDSQVTYSMTGGFTGVLSQGAWTGQYVYAGPSAFISFRENLAFIPSLTFEVAPGSGNWGFVGTGTIELLLPKGPFSIDLVPSISQDTTPNGTTTFSWSVGPGVSLAFLNGMSLSGTFQASGIIGDIKAGIVLLPTLSFSIPIR